jgi:hypothetical protein
MYKSLLNNSEGDELIIGGDYPFSGVSILFQTLLFLSIGALPFVISCIQNQVLNFCPTGIFHSVIVTLFTSHNL